MKRRFSRALDVSTPDKRRVVAVISADGKSRRIEVGYLAAVDKDGPQFARNGVIRLTTTAARYQATIEALTGYLESLFLRELGQGEIDADVYSGLGAVPPRRGDAPAVGPREIELERKKEWRPPSIRPRSRRRKQAEGAGGGTAAPHLDEGGDPSTG